MKRNLIAAALAAGLLMPGAILAQGQGVDAQKKTDELRGSLTLVRQALIATGVETRITTGRPYSAEAVTETTQSLSDGNRIERRSMTRIYRDGQGRTRREQLGSGTSVQNILISDPVAHVSYTLDGAKKIAYQTGGTVVAPSGADWTGGARGRVGGTGVISLPGGSGGGAAPTGRSGGGGGGFGGRGVGLTTADNQNSTTEDLGQQTIEGIAAKGTRTTTIIPAGAIGNVQDIKIVSEQWFSDDLQVLVMTKHSDPRSGETIYRLRNIVRAEPDASLFMVPGDYTIQQRGVR